MTVTVVLPDGVDDPAAPSGGNRYDRQVCRRLPAYVGVREVTVRGAWPRPTATDRAALAGVLAAVPDGSVVLIDGLVACGVPDVVVPAAGRLRLAILVHLPLADETGLSPAEAAELDDLERRTLRAASAVIVTSTWAAHRLTEHHRLPGQLVRAAVPGVDQAPLSPGTGDGSALLCVAAVTPRKGHDVLIESLATLTDLPWTCVCVGATDRAPDHVERLRRLAGSYGLGERVRFVGPRTSGDLAGAYAAADLLVLPSHAETYGMVVTEALARGLPVVASAVGGVPEAMGRTARGDRPGALVPPGDPAALAGALGGWLRDPGTRRRLRDAARDRRAGLPGWDATARSVADVLGALRTTVAGDRERAVPADVHPPGAAMSDADVPATPVRRFR